MTISIFLRSTISASAPAGRVKMRNGNEATVDIKDIKKGDAVSVFMTQVAAVSCAATQVPDTKLQLSESRIAQRAPSGSQISYGSRFHFPTVSMHLRIIFTSVFL